MGGNIVILHKHLCENRTIDRRKNSIKGRQKH